ncbi:hypothetical protein B0H10DRAFT_2206230 [Mycena sp. CBHHK59/15]|nr:hypothetical protein B0H10DRAFT_2206230 [Mycena sp. CBHHK59/15]
MDKDLTAEDVGYALKLSNNGKAPGVDGIPYEFYKILDIIYRQSKGTDEKMFDVLSFLTKLYDDIEKYGIIKSTHFNTQWLCPLFKKTQPVQRQSVRAATTSHPESSIRILMDLGAMREVAISSLDAAGGNIDVDASLLF